MEDICIKICLCRTVPKAVQPPRYSAKLRRPAKELTQSDLPGAVKSIPSSNVTKSFPQQPANAKKTGDSLFNWKRSPVSSGYAEGFMLCVQTKNGSSVR